MIFIIQNITIDLKGKLVFVPMDYITESKLPEYIVVPNSNITKRETNKYEIDLNFLTTDGKYQIRGLEYENSKKYILNCWILHKSNDNIELILETGKVFDKDVDYTDYDLVINYKDYRIVQCLVHENKMAVRIDGPVVDEIKDPIFLQYHYFDTQELHIILEEDVPYKEIIIYAIPIEYPKDVPAFYGSGSKEYKTRPQIGTDISKIKSLYGNLLPIDYGKYEDFTWFGSAYGRFTTMYNKIANFVKQYDKISLSASYVNKFIESLNSYEIWCFSHYSNYSSSSPYNEGDYPKYLDVDSNICFYYPSSSQVQNWYTYWEISSLDYDKQNYDRIIYQIPQIYLEHDSNKSLEKLLNAFGDFIDLEIYQYIKYLPEIIYPQPYKTHTGLDKFLPEIIQRLYNIDVYTIEKAGLDSYYQMFSDSGLNPDKLINAFYIRLYTELPFLFQKKGTYECLYDLFNVLGVPNDWFEVWETVHTDFVQYPEYTSKTIEGKERIVIKTLNTTNL